MKSLRQLYRTIYYPIYDLINRQIVNGRFVSVWDGGIEIWTNCKVNLRTGEVFNIQQADIDDSLNTLDREYVLVGLYEPCGIKGMEILYKPFPVSCISDTSNMPDDDNICYCNISQYCYK